MDKLGYHKYGEIEDSCTRKGVFYIERKKRKEGGE